MWRWSVLAVALTTLSYVIAIEKRQADPQYQAFFNNLVIGMPNSACYPCPWEVGEECCSFKPLNGPHRDERPCSLGLVWDSDACNCAFPDQNLLNQNPIPAWVCHPIRNCTVPLPASTTITPTCPALNDDQCCLPNVGQWYTLVDDNHYRINGGIIQECPVGMKFNVDDCCCEGPPVAPILCKHWTFEDRLFPYVDEIQKTWGTPVRASVQPSLNGNGLHLKPNQRLSIPFFAGGHLGDRLSISFWVRTDSENLGSLVLSNGNRFNRPTLGVMVVGNSIGGGLATEKEAIPDTLDLPLTSTGSNGWTFFAMVYDDPDLTFYVNDNPGTTVENGGRIIASRCQLNIGGVLFPDLDLDDLVICDFAWNSTQVDNLRLNGNIPKLDLS